MKLAVATSVYIQINHKSGDVFDELFEIGEVDSTPHWVLFERMNFIC